MENEKTVDKVFIEGLRADTTIGVFDWERRIKQSLYIDLEMAFDNRPAAKSDDLNDTLNYKAVSDRVVAFIEQSEYQLIETVAEKACELLQQEFSIPWIKLTLSKPGALPNARNVGLCIERGTL